MSSAPVPTVPDTRLVLSVDFAGLRWDGVVTFPPEYLPADGALDCDGLEVRSVRQGARALPFSRTPDGLRLLLAERPDPTAMVEVEFAGRVEEKGLFGLYRSGHGPGYVLTSHCEPTGARKIFPCVDRPDRKVRLHLTVRTEPGLEVVSNGAVRGRSESGGVAEWTFEPTPPMSTYLFYLGIGRFDTVEVPSGTVALRVMGAPGRREAGRWAAEMGPRVLRALEQYYGIPYPLPKLDLLAISEHAFGAMENWGAISFQESRLLFDASSNAFSRRDIVETIAHEIAHQWFGNLVTMAWWDDIWLNESFAALMETKITEEIAPEFEPWTDFFLRVAGIAAALDGDSLRCTHPIRARVERPEEMSQIFDEISYGKGSAVLAMLDHHLGADTFRAGVKAYLERFAYANGRTEDLIAALAAASGEDVARLASPWIDRPGLPVVRVRAVPQGLALTQRRFAYLGPTEEAPWPIPLTVDVDGAPRRLRFDTRSTTIEAPAGSTVHLNPGAIGFYRVQYEGELFERLLAALPARPPADRWAFLSDLGAFLLAGEADWSTYVRAATALRSTDDRLVLEALLGTIASTALAFPENETLRRDALEFLGFAGARFGLDARPGESPSAGILRDRISYHRVRLDPRFAAEIAPRFADYDRVDPNLRSAVAIAPAVADGRAGFDELTRVLRAGRSTTADALRFARGLAWSSDPALVERTLEMLVSGELNRSHIVNVAAQAALNPRGREATWRWLERRTEELTATFRGSGYLPLLLEQTIPLAGLGREGEVRSHFERHPTDEGRRGLTKGLERLEILGRFRSRLPR